MLQVSFETRGFPGTIKISPLVLVLEWISVHPASNPTQRSRPEREEPEMRVEVEGFGFGSPQSPPTPGRHTDLLGEGGCRRGWRGSRSLSFLQLPRKSGQSLEE